MRNTLSQRADGDFFFLVDLLRFRLFDESGRRLHLDHMRAEESGEMRSIGGDIDGGFAVFAQAFAAWVAPHHNRKATGFCFRRQLADFFHLVVGLVTTGIDSEANRRTAEAQRISNRRGDSLIRRGVFRGDGVIAVHFQNQRHGTGEGIRPGFDHAQRRGEGVEAGVDREFEMIMRVVRRWVRRKAARRAVLEALVDRQDHHFTGAAEFAGHQHAREVGLGAGIVRLVPGENFFNFARQCHGVPRLVWIIRV